MKRPNGGAPGDPRAVLESIASRVRAARTARGWSRAKLAARAGLSLRFLAQVEGGAANVSILRLQEIAQALGTEIAALVAPDRTPPTTPVRQAPPAERQIALLGLRGAGKSTVGRKLASRLRVPFFELDHLVERAAGLPLAQIFELHGETYFRRLERAALERFLTEHPAGVLATGGGIVTEPETWALLRERCTTVWLRARPDQHWQRVVRQGDRRPMRGNPDAMRELRALLRRRAPLYARAELVVDTRSRGVGRTVDAVAAALRPRTTKSRSRAARWPRRASAR